MTRCLPPCVVVAVTALIGFSGCNSDETPASPAVTNPVYIWAGTGHGGLGQTGQLPRETRLSWPQDVTFTPDGRPVVIDWNNHRIIALDAGGKFMLLAGAAENDFGDPCPAAPAECMDIVATSAKLNHPASAAFTPDGNMVLCAWHNSALFQVDMSTGLMDRFVGTGVRPCFGPASDPQDVTKVCVDLPSSVIFDSQGRLVFTDQGNHIIRRVDNGVIETIAGTQPIPSPGSTPPNPVGFLLQFGFTGDGGPATSAKIQFERGRLADPSGRICYDANWNLYIADTANHAVRRVDTDGIITRVAGAAPVDDGTGRMIGQPGYSGDGGPATSAKLHNPRDVAVDFDGTLFIADSGNNVIRMVSPGGTISTLIGVQRNFRPAALEQNVLLAEDGASAGAVRLTEPSGVAVDAAGRLWVADTGNNVIRIFER